MEQQTWEAFEGGRTLHQVGTEGGTIMLDDEHPAGARITVEAECLRAPYAVTCGVYGWLVHTRFFTDGESAYFAAEEMKTALEKIVLLLPDEDDPAPDLKLDAVSEAISAFGERFP